MKNCRYILLGVICCAALVSCRREDLWNHLRSGNEINLVAALPGGGATLSSTRASGQSAYKGIINGSEDYADDFAIGYLRIDQDSSDYVGKVALDYKNAVYADPNSFSPKDYTYSKGNPHYYYSTADLGGDAGYRDVDFDILQYFKDDANAVTYYGWYPYGNPQGGTDAFKVGFSLDGRTDVIYSDAASQRMNQSSDTMSMHHALCQYRIWVYRKMEVGTASDTTGAGLWGRITDIISAKQMDSATFTPSSGMSFCYRNSSSTDFDLRSNLDSAKLVDGVLTGDNLHGVYYVRRERVNGNDYNGMTIPIGESNMQKIACYMAPAPEDGNLSLRIITDATGGAAGDNTKNLSVAGKFTAGSAYDIVLCFSDHGFISAHAVASEWQSYGSDIEVDVTAKMYYDLSRYGTANCYMVSSANVGYSFQGDVKGCGNSEGGGSIVGIDDCSLPSDCHIDILWQSSDSLITLDAQSLIEGKVLFWVPGVSEKTSEGKTDLRLKKKGNAIIAARKEKEGEILWSWHIWVTDRPLDQGYMNGYDAMDRNLGALTGPNTQAKIKAANDSCWGFYYQWGRKDPMIPGVTKWSTQRLADTSACVTAGIQNPLAMYRDWNVDAMSSVMGYLSARDNVKSIFDPCPPGYRAPESEAFRVLDNYKTTDFTPGVAGGIFTGGDNTYIFYPDAGFVFADSLNVVDGETISRKYQNDGNGEIYLYTTAPEDFIDGATGKLLKISTIPQSPRDYRTYQATSAFSMRCISTGSKSRVTNLCETQTANCYIIPDFGAYKFRVDIKGNGVKQVNLAGSMRQIYDSDYSIDISTINHVAVLWWQGDVSGTYSNNTASGCPIKFVNDGKSLPRTPSHASSDFGSDDLTVPDSDGYVQFYVEEEAWAPGNALVAAFDASNNILWSWHLWFTDTPENVTLGPNTLDSYAYEYSIMDRNLGATYNPTSSPTDAQALGSIGLYYQWGRKDPIQGPQSLSDITSGSSTATQSWYKRDVDNGYAWTTESAIEVSAAVENPNTSIANPTVFYSNNEDVHILVEDGRYLFEKNWYSEKFGWDYSWWQEIGSTTSRNLDEEKTFSFVGRWGYNTPNHGLALDPPVTKTMYDPCPPGYFVAPHGVLAAADLVSSADTTAVDRYDSSSFTWEANKTISGGETWGIFIDSSTYPVSQKFWIPFGGYRDYQSGKFNTSHFGNYNNRAAVWFVSSDFKSRAYVYESGVRSVVVTATGAGQILGQRPADAANIRCRAY